MTPFLTNWSRSRNWSQLFSDSWSRNRSRSQNFCLESESELESRLLESVHDSMSNRSRSQGSWSLSQNRSQLIFGNWSRNRSQNIGLESEPGLCWSRPSLTPKEYVRPHNNPCLSYMTFQPFTLSKTWKNILITACLF